MRDEQETFDEAIKSSRGLGVALIVTFGSLIGCIVTGVIIWMVAR